MADFLDPTLRQVETYLDQVLAPLTQRLSALQQQELRRELHQHLLARVDAYRELGMTEAEAVTEALQQFGGAEDFLRQWRLEWRKTPPQAVLREIAAATRCALLLSLPALLITCLGSPIWGHALDGRWVPNWMQSWPVAYITSGWGSLALDLIVLPFMVGAAVGHLMPQRAGLGMLAALTFEMVLTDWYLLPDVLNLGWFAERLTMQIFLCSIFWLPLACTSAAVSGWWTLRHRKEKVLA